MKPKMFIGSSSEGLKISHAIQSNLFDSAEVTVWDQGNFELSKSTFESLCGMASQFDYAAFIFTPDDIVQIRGKQSTAVRDNVLFELGLFMGKIGPERCFIVVPNKSSELRIPTDLLGVVLAVYEGDRSDDNFKAATAPAVFEIKKSLVKYGCIRRGIAEEQTGGEGVKIQRKMDDVIITDNNTVVKNTDEDKKYNWIQLFIDKKYNECFDEFIKSLKVYPDLREHEDFWTMKIGLKVDYGKYKALVDNGIKNNDIENDEIIALVDELMEIGKPEMALYYCEFGISKDETNLGILRRKGDAINKLHGHSKAIEFFDTVLSKLPGALNIHQRKAELLYNNGNKSDAIHVLEGTKGLIGLNIEVLHQLVSWYFDMNDHDNTAINCQLALSITGDDPYYLTMMGNALNGKELYSASWEYYERGNKVADEKQGWILGNIGNLLKNRGLHSASVSYLERAVAIDSDNEYALSRLAAAKKSHAEELLQVGKIIRN